MADGADVPPWDSERGSPRTGQLRRLLSSPRQDGVDQQRALEALDQEMFDRSGDGNIERSRRDIQARLQDQNQAQDHEIVAVAEGLPSNSSPSSLIRSRRRAFRPSQRLQRQRESHESNSRSEIDNTGNVRRETSQAFTDTARDEYLTEARVNGNQRYRAKRRRLNDGSFDDESRVYNYGDKGRAVPGQLKLELISCDGGEHAGNPTGMASHVLQDNNFVYSTKDNRCNMLLKHVGGMPFSLSRIVFKAPKTGYDAPVQEGMLFVAMDDEQLLERTAEYEKHYAPKGYRQHHTQRRRDVHRPSQQYMQGSGYSPSTMDRTRYQRDSYSHHPGPRHHEINPELEASQVPGFEVSFSDPSDSEDITTPPRYSESSYRSPDLEYSVRAYADTYRPNYDRDPLYVDLSASSSESEDEESPTFHGEGTENDQTMEASLTRQRFLLHRMQMTHDRTSSNHPRPPPSNTQVLSREWRDVQNLVRLRGSTPSPVRSWYNFPGSYTRQSPSNINAPSTTTKGQTGGASSRNGGASSSTETLAPHARFFIRKNKAAVAVNFDPPVAGRYLLIKLWSSCPNGNIDIKSIIATGYGGPRFFPSIELR